MRTKIKEKSLTPAGFEPMTSWLEHRRSTNWATRPGWVTLWSKYFITLFVTHAKTGWLGRSCLDLYYHCKHVKNTINHQLLKFTPLRLVSYVAVIYFDPKGRENNGGLMLLGLFLFLFFGGHLPQTSARSKQYLAVIFVRLAFIRQNFHESWCRKLLAI